MIVSGTLIDRINRARPAPGRERRRPGMPMSESGADAAVDRVH
jgi:hypothetical protein